MTIIHRKKLRSSIPLSSMADIAFLLLIFFLVTSVLKFQDESTVIVPSVSKTEVIDQKDRIDIWITRDGVISIKNKRVTVEETGIMLRQMVILNKDLLVFVNADHRSKFLHVEKVINMLSDTGACNVVFVAKNTKANKPVMKLKNSRM